MPRGVTNGMLLILALLVAVAPVVLMRWALSLHASRQAQVTMQIVAKRMAGRVDAVMSEAADILAALSPEIRNGCTVKNRELLSSTAFDAFYVKSITVLDAGGNALCGSSDVLPTRLGDMQFRPARQKNLQIAVSSASDGQRKILHLAAQEGGLRIIATLAPDTHILDAMPVEWRSSGLGTIAFDDGALAGGVPAGEQAFASADKGPIQILTESAGCERFPLRATVYVPFDAIWAVDKSLALFVNFAGGGMGLLFFAFVINAARRPVSVEDALQRGIRRDEFVPYYQPVFDIQRGALIGCEVLIRWIKHDGTVVPPGAFIQQAEESGLAVEMTKQLMRKARDEVGARYAERPGLKLAFNLFADHFSDLSTVEDVRDIFASGGVRYRQLVFEITERYPLPNLNRAKIAISGLQDLGCRVALDDAGTGHGGLAYLQTLGMDQIKIDKLFVDTINADTITSPIVDSLIDIGRSMGMEIVAEGVETADQLHYLKARGVNAAQGYLFAKPLPGSAYAQMIDAMLPKTGEAVLDPIPALAREAA